jgi:hypothetical protein
MWEAKVLLGADKRLARVAMSIISHYWGDDATRLKALFGLVWPGFTGIKTPFLASCGRILRDGTVRADVVTDDGHGIVRNLKLFDTLTDLQSAFRRIADRLKLNDADRVDLFAAIQNWITVDYRQRFDEVEDKPRLNGRAHG